ncbi:hypothetical protein CR194_19815 [Salipaludibacillus keqinensis]|uniref:Uncharacterized protein n=1 Tax=Salipaludibacillus keqinensis TaxID=2045207 RepID=A0A323T4N8_9BACI|nr:hypothetical protein CR194_19815 [Salipaludibacillus keqinensis]
MGGQRKKCDIFLLKVLHCIRRSWYIIIRRSETINNDSEKQEKSFSIKLLTKDEKGDIFIESPKTTKTNAVLLQAVLSKKVFLVSGLGR